MDTTERMMIMGMCLQGILTNPVFATVVDDSSGFKTLRPMTPEECKAQIVANIKLAHQYADALDPPPEKTDAEAIARLTGIAYEALRSQKMLVRPDIPWSEAKGTEEGDPVFDAVQLYYHSPTALTVTAEDRLVQAIVRAAK